MNLMDNSIGYTISLLLASRGCKVIIVDCEDAEESKNGIIKETGNPHVFYRKLDLSSLSDIREFANSLTKEENKIDILINNAGVAISKEYTTKDGLNSVMQINYFGAFLLTHSLLDLLKASCSARIIFLGSVSIFSHNLTLETLNPSVWDEDLDAVKLYGNSKLCDVLAAQEFDKKLSKYGIHAYSVDPGAVRTDIFRKATEVHTSWRFTLPLALTLLLIGQDVYHGVQTIFHVATSKSVKYNGEHYSFLRPWFKPKVLRDQKFCDDIWRETENLVKLTSHEKL